MFYCRFLKWSKICWSKYHYYCDFVRRTNFSSSQVRMLFSRCHNWIANWHRQAVLTIGTWCDDCVYCYELSHLLPQLHYFLEGLPTGPRLFHWAVVMDRMALWIEFFQYSKNLVSCRFHTRNGHNFSETNLFQSASFVS